MRQRALLILSVSLIGVGFVGLTAAAILGSMTALAPGSSGGGRAGRVDAMFIEQMVPHHQDAIDMARLARTRAEHPELAALAARIEQSQSAENEQMRDWYREWFGGPVPDVGGMGGPMGPMMGAGTDLERLRAAEDFDREFIEQMVPHHRMAIMMATMAGRSTSRPEIRRLTDSIIETQSQEIEDMQRWYREWYGR